MEIENQKGKIEIALNEAKLGKNAWLFTGFKQTNASYSTCSFMAIITLLQI